MLREKQIIKDKLTIFHFPYMDENGNWSVKITQNNECVKSSYALNEDHANIIRGEWINLFWGNQLN